MSMKDPLYPVTWVKAHLYDNKSSSNHKVQPEPAQTCNFWKMWIVLSWKGNILQLLDLGKKKYTLSISASKTDRALKLESYFECITATEEVPEVPGHHLPARYLSRDDEVLWFQL